LARGALNPTGEGAGRNTRGRVCSPTIKRVVSPIRFGAATSTNLFQWTIEESAGFPPDARHGSVARLTDAEAVRLRGALVEKEH